MLSVPHLIIIFVVALVVFGPEKLPELARNLGKVMSEFRRATGDIRSTFEDHLRDLEREADERRIGGSHSQAPRQFEATTSTGESAPPNAVTTTPPSARANGDSLNAHASDDSGGPCVTSGETDAAWQAKPEPPEPPASDETVPSASPHSESDSHIATSHTKSETVSDGHS
jgi:sec-independent protein translocase protein TatB